MLGNLPVISNIFYSPQRRRAENISDEGLLRSPKVRSEFYKVYPIDIYVISSSLLGGQQKI